MKPAYLRIFENIVDKINNKSYVAGEMLPSEAEFEVIFGVSRTPVRAALKQLENEGYIYRIQGKGSYVMNQESKEKWTVMTGFENEYAKDWGKISARTIECKKVVHPVYAREYNLPEDVELIYLARIRYHKGEPVIYQEHFLPPILPLEIFKENTNFISLQHFLGETLQLEYSYSREEMEAVIADDKITKELQIPKTTPLIKSKRISYVDNKLIDINIFYVNSTIWKYSVSYQY